MYESQDKSHPFLFRRILNSDYADKCAIVIYYCFLYIPLFIKHFFISKNY